MFSMEDGEVEAIKKQFRGVSILQEQNDSSVIVLHSNCIFPVLSQQDQIVKRFFQFKSAGRTKLVKNPRYFYVIPNLDISIRSLEVST